jgi:hypothetical protein
MSATQLFIVGRNIENTASGVVWDCVGVFSSEARALAVCLDENYFIGPVKLNQEIPVEMWPGCRYPMAKRVRQ